jgi:hypothetical protein
MNNSEESPKFKAKVSKFALFLGTVVTVFFIEKALSKLLEMF